MPSWTAASRGVKSDPLFVFSDLLPGMQQSYLRVEEKINSSRLTYKITQNNI